MADQPQHMTDRAQPTERAEVIENLLYCINAEPRLFRWNAGVIEWSDPADPGFWHVLPGQR